MEGHDKSGESSSPEHRMDALSTLVTSQKRPHDALRDDAGSFRAPGFGNFGLYMEQKAKKLREQDEKREKPDVKQVFAGMTIHINGYTEGITQQELKTLILDHGGQFDHYFRSTTTHMVASNLTEAKKNELRNFFNVASPQWIVDSVKAGRALPLGQYSVFNRPTNALSSASFKARDASEPDFISEYYRNSRLHHLSTWKNELQELVRPMQAKLQERAKERAHSRRQERPDEPELPKVFMHVDMDCFFVSVALLSRPDMVDKPVGVCHARSMIDHGSSEIASCNYVARARGIRNGFFTGKAKEICPDLILLPYEFDKYREVTKILYGVLQEYADNLLAVSCDEAYIDVTTQVDSSQPALTLAHSIRADIFSRTKCTASVGIGNNMLLARLATSKAKPNGAYQIHSAEEFMTFLPSMTVRDLPGIGRVTERRLQEMGIQSAHDLWNIPKEKLQEEFGPKTGAQLYNLCRGIDNREFVSKPRQSVSADVNYGIRFVEQSQAHTFLHELAKEVSHRLDEIECQAGHITLKILKRQEDASASVKHMGHGQCDAISKSQPFRKPTRDPFVLAQIACQLLDAMAIPATDLRGIGLSCTRLVENQLLEDNAPGSILHFARRSPTKPTTSSTIARSTVPGPREGGLNQEEIATERMSTEASLGHPGCSSTSPPGRYPQPFDYSQSEIDWEAFQALPLDIQEEVQKGFQRRQAERKRLHTATTTRMENEGGASVSPSKRSPAASSPSRRRATPLKSPVKPARDIREALSNVVRMETGVPVEPVLFSGKTFEELVDETLKHELNEDVLHELPPEMREEVVEDMRKAIETRLNESLMVRKAAGEPYETKSASPISLSKTGSSGMQVEGVNRQRLRVSASPPSGTAADSGLPRLLGQSNIKDVRCLLREWISHSVHHLDETDIAADQEVVREYVSKLIDRGYLNEASLVLRYLRYLSSPDSEVLGSGDGALGFQSATASSAATDLTMHPALVTPPLPSTLSGEEDEDEEKPGPTQALREVVAFEEAVDVMQRTIRDIIHSCEERIYSRYQGTLRIG